MKHQKIYSGFNKPMYGVTMAEVLVVIAIIGVISAMAVPSYHAYRAKLLLGEALDKFQEGLMNTRITAIKANFPIYHAPLGTSFNNGYTRKIMSAPPALTPTSLEYSGAAFNSKITYSAVKGDGTAVKGPIDVNTTGIGFDRQGKLVNIPGDVVITFKSAVTSTNYYEGSLTIGFNGLVTKQCCTYK